MYVDSSLYPPIASGYYPTEGLNMLPATQTGAAAMGSPIGQVAPYLGAMALMQNFMPHQQQQQMPQSTVVAPRTRMNMNDWLKYYGLLA